ncbi:hypothetical protein Hanom_Chr14g01290061 [Helianthus anomalus]
MSPSMVRPCASLRTTAHLAMFSMEFQQDDFASNQTQVVHGVRVLQHLIVMINIASS